MYIRINKGKNNSVYGNGTLVSLYIDIFPFEVTPSLIESDLLVVRNVVLIVQMMKIVDYQYFWFPLASLV